MNKRTVAIDNYEEMMQGLGEMEEMYSDETRDDWFDADDYARDIAENVYKAMLEQEGLMTGPGIEPAFPEHCPCCGGADIYLEDRSIDKDGNRYESWECLDCEARWVETLRFERYEITKGNGRRSR